MKRTPDPKNRGFPLYYLLFTVYDLTTAIGLITGISTCLIIVSAAGSGVAAAEPGLANQAQPQLRRVPFLTFLILLIGVTTTGYSVCLGTGSKDDYNRYDRPVGEVR